MECLVCQVPNTGQHFGVSCCRACAAFFRRSLQLRLQYKCRFINDCDVAHKNRYSCRACRMTKCYRLGMGNHENARRELVKQKKNFEQLVPEDGPSSSEQSLENRNTPPETEQTNVNFSIDVASILKRHLDQIFRQPRLRNKSPLCEQALEAYKRHNAFWPNCTPNNIIHTVVVDLNAFMQANYAEIEILANFCMDIFNFSQLPIHEKWLVFKHFWPRFVELDRIYVSAVLLGYDRDDGRTVNFDGKVVNFILHGCIRDLPTMSDMTEDQIRVLLEKSVLNTKKVFSDPFKIFKPDVFELIYMMMYMMWDLRDLTGVSNSTILMAESIQTCLAEELNLYYMNGKKTENYANRIYKIHHLLHGLDKVSTIRKEDGYMASTFNVFKQDIFLNDLK